MLFVFSHHCPVSFIKAEFYMFLFFLWSSTHDMAECGNKQMLFTLSLLGQVSWPQSLSIHRDLTAGKGLGRLYSAKRDLRCALIGSCQPGEAKGRPIIDRSRHPHDRLGNTYSAFCADSKLEEGTNTKDIMSY